jgi:D-alanine-D-alanine ligase
MKKNICVTFAGKSVEHEVSVVTALQAINSLNTEKYNVVPLYITKEGEWYTGESLLDIENYKNIPRLLNIADRVNLPVNAGEYRLYYTEKKIKSPLSFNKSKTYIPIDVLFPVNHGTYGEDGALQGVFECTDIPYIGSNVIGSAAGMDKTIMKNVFRGAGLNTLDFIWFHRQDWIEKDNEIIEEIKDRIGFPCIIKPAIAGSSIGVNRATNIDELYETVLLASRFCPKIIVERYISNMMEINCAVLGTSFRNKASVCERPLGTGEILDYEAKYIREQGGAKSDTGSSKSGGMTSMDRVIPADIPDEISKKIQSLAKRAFTELYASGVARIDFMIDKDTDEIYVNELNGIPGSLSYYLWEKSGLKYSEMLDELIEIAFENYRLKKETIYSYDSNLLNLQSGSGQKSGGMKR